MYDLPPQVLRAMEMLNAAGHRAYLVGGAVRELLRGRGALTDFDLTTSARPEETERVFSGFRLVETGLKHGTVTVLMDGLPLEITTFRVDGTYSDGRHPDGVAFTPSLERDLERRDFTINAMAYHPGEGLIDLHGGREDLAAGLVRCVGDPDRRFQEDGLRMLRCMRFAAVLDFRVEEDTGAALLGSRALLDGIARERVREELTRLLCGPAAGRVLEAYAPVAAQVLPELVPAFGFDQRNPWHDRDVWHHTLAAVDAAPATPVLRWAAMLHDLGKPACFTLDEKGVGHFYGHGEESARLAGEILSRLRFDTDTRQKITALVALHDRPIVPERRPIRRLLARLGPEGTAQLIALHRADNAAQSPLAAGRQEELDRARAVLDQLLAEGACFQKKDLAVNGRDMLELGLRGPEIGRALDRCLEAVLAEQLPNQRGILMKLAGESMG